MPIDLATLLATRTAEQIYDDMLSYLGSLPVPLPIANWRVGGPYRTLLRVGGVALEKLYALQVALARGGYLPLASGAWLTALAEDRYGETRQPATFAAGDVTLTAAPGAGPYTLGPGAVIVSTPSGLKYRATNAAPLTLPAGGSVVVPVKAVSPGGAYNVGGGAISRLDTPTLLGVTVSNAGGWQTAAGADEESDEKLRLRCASKWGTLSTERGIAAAPAAGYVYWALTASPEITRVVVFSDRDESGARAPGTVTVMLAGDAAAISDAARDAAKALIDPRAPVCSRVKYVKAQPQTVVVSGNVNVYTASLAEAPAKIQAGLDSLQKRIPLMAAAYRSAVLDAIHYGPAVRDAPISSPVGDTTPAWARFVVFSNTLTLQGV